MGKIIATTNATLDGIVQDPDGAEGFGRGGWFGQFGAKDLEEWAEVETAGALGAEALLLGGGATSGSPHAGHRAAASGRTS